MTKEEYIKRMKEDDEWAPGWDAIDAEFDRLYPGQEPAHYATTIESRAMFGGVEFLEGFSAFDMGNGCRHIVTYGMTELYADEKAFGGAFSRWGYEMTFKIKAQTGEPFECIHGGTPLHEGTDSKITSVITVADTAARSLDTVNGRVDFIQLVGITEEEYQAIQQDIGNIHKLIDLMKQDNPELVTDMDRTESYL